MAMSSMAHGPNAMAQTHAHTQIPSGGHATAGPGVGVPTNLAALGADLIDKQQSGLTKAQVRNATDKPIVAVDLYGVSEVAFYPPGEADNDQTTIKVKAMGKAVASGSDLMLKQNDAAAYKAVRNWLSKGNDHLPAVLQTAVLEAVSEDGAKVPRPHVLLGARRCSNLPKAFKEEPYYPCVDDTPADGTSAVIAEQAHANETVVLRDGTLDGSLVTKQNDFDRVVVDVKLLPTKKHMTVFPEEAVQILLAKAQSMVHNYGPMDGSDVKEIKEDDDEDPLACLEAPIAVAIPGWACQDASMEALTNATSSSNAILLFQRPVAALAGALLPRPVKQTGNLEQTKLLAHIQNDSAKENQSRAKEALKNGEDEDAVDPYLPCVVLVGLTPDGLDLTCVQLSSFGKGNAHCLFGDYKVISNVSYQGEGVNQLSKGMDILRANVDRLAPESETPIACITYGQIKDQIACKGALDKALAQYSKNPQPDCWGKETLQLFSTKEECVAMGTAVLGAVSHGRIKALSDIQTASKKKRARLGLLVQNVAPSAVAISCCYNKKWTPPKVIFDFDRRVPAGPFAIDLNAADCAAYRANPELDNLEEAALKFQGASKIPDREEAALNFSLKVLQKQTRDGPWITVGDSISPLCMTSADDDGKTDKESTKIACESAILELSLTTTGLITSILTSDGKSVVQATKSARNSKILYYVGILFATLFFGGFMFKSYWDEHVLQRDTERVLQFYKHMAPNSYAAGDERNARYLVWKYRGKKDRLWRRLEVKYNHPVLNPWEWPDEPENEEEEDEIDLDNDKSEKTDEEPKDETQDEPDL